MKDTQAEVISDLFLFFNLRLIISLALEIDSLNSRWRTGSLLISRDIPVALTSLSQAPAQKKKYINK